MENTSMFISQSLSINDDGEVDKESLFEEEIEEPADECYPEGNSFELTDSVLTFSSTTHHYDNHSMRTSVSTSLRRDFLRTESTTCLPITESTYLLVNSFAQKSETLLREDDGIDFVTVKRIRHESESQWRFSNSVLSPSIQFVTHTVSTLFHQRSQLLTISLPEMISHDRKASTWLTFLNTLSLCTGISCLAVPFTVAYGGIAVLVLIFSLGLLSWYTSNLTLECQFQKSKSGEGKRVHATFMDIGIAAFPEYGTKIMKAVISSSVLSDIYALILLGEAISNLIKVQSIQLSSQEWMPILGCVIFPFFIITKISILAWFGMASLICFTTALAVTVGYLCQNASQWNVSNLLTPFNLKYFAIAYGILLNSYNIHLTMPSIESGMKEPERCKKVIGTTFIINIIIKVCFGVFGALMFGHLVKQSVTNNLNVNQISLVVNIFIALNLVLTFPVSLFVIFEMIDIYFLPYFALFSKEDKISYSIWVVLTRLLVLCFIIFVAVSIPEFGLVVGFIGSIRGTLIAVVLPICFYLRLKWRKISYTSKGFHLVILFVCSAFSIIGTYYSVSGMVSGI